MVPKAFSKNSRLNTKFITMDLETITYNNTLIPYLLCWYDGKIKKHYFITSPAEVGDFITLNNGNVESSVLAMVLDAMKDICTRKYKGYKIYLHNFSKFDGYFLIKCLNQLGVCKPIIHKGRIISCKFKLFESNYNVTFMDSLLILPSSLRKLSESFSVETVKTHFPFHLQDINYKGPVPDIGLFDNISLLEYNNYKKQFIAPNKVWSFRDESIKYCQIDCIALYQTLVKFNQLIFNKFKLDITKYPTSFATRFSF